MSDEFLRPTPLYRLAQTNYGDDLQSVAARELGDANRWPELIWLNNLIAPYLTDDQAQVETGVLLSGSLIKVPSPVSYTEDSDNDSIFERDVVLIDKKLVFDETGDFMVVSGSKSLVMQLTHRINTPRGQARRHGSYGCLLWTMLGTVGGASAAALGNAYVRSALLADYRVSAVLSAVTQVVGDTVQITATAQTIDGGSIDIVI